MIPYDNEGKLVHWIPRAREWRGTDSKKYAIALLMGYNIPMLYAGISPIR